METKKKLKILFLLAFAIFFIQYVSANTLNNYVLESVGLNTTINLTFQITFDELIITDHSIEIYNLSYIHPSSCNSQLSSSSLFNYTTTNQTLTGTQAFSHIQCNDKSVNIIISDASSSNDSIVEISNISNYIITHNKKLLFGNNYKFAIAQNIKIVNMSSLNVEIINASKITYKVYNITKNEDGFEFVLLVNDLEKVDSKIIKFSLLINDKDNIFLDLTYYRKTFFDKIFGKYSISFKNYAIMLEESSYTFIIFLFLVVIVVFAVIFIIILASKHNK